MHHFRSLAGLVAIAAAGLAPAAGGAAPLAFDCDVPEAHSSSVSSAVGPSVRVTAKITAVALRPGKTPPLAGVLVTSSTGRNAIGVRLILPRADATALQVVVVGLNDGQPVQQLVREVPLNGSVRFALDLDPAGAGRLTIDDQVIPTTFANMGVGRARAFCGSGQFRIENLELATP